jgi:hypothetical protein
MPPLNRVVSPPDLQAGRAREEIAKEIDKLDFDKTPLLRILMEAGKEKSGQMTYNWLTKERRPDWGGIVSYGGAWAAGAATSGTITVTAGEGWLYAEGDIIQIPDNAQVNLYIDSVAGDVITGRTYDNTTTVNLSAGPTGANRILGISDTFGLASNRGTMKQRQPDTNLNYIQIIQHPYGIAETTNFIEYDAGGNELMEQEEDAFLAHEFSKEKLFFFGQKHVANPGYMTSGGNLAQYFTGGLYEAAQSNTVPGAVISEADLTYQEFSDWCAIWTKYAKKPVVFAGELIYGALPFWLRENLQTEQSEDTLGIAVTNFRTIYGQIIKVIAHRDLLVNHYGGYAFGVDLDDIKYRFLQGEDTHVEKDIQLPGDKQFINEFRTWFGVYIGNAKRHGLISDVATISA